MVKSVDSFGFSIIVVNVFLNVKTIHKNESWWRSVIKKFLFKTIAVLSVVDKNFPTICWRKPFVIRLKEANVEATETGVKRNQILNGYC